MRALCCLTRALLGDKEVCYGDLSAAPIVFSTGVSLSASNSSLNSSAGAAPAVAAAPGPKSKEKDKEKESKLAKQELSSKGSIHASLSVSSHRGSMTPSASTPVELIRNTVEIRK